MAAYIHIQTNCIHTHTYSTTDARVHPNTHIIIEGLELGVDRPQAVCKIIYIKYHYSYYYYYYYLLLLHFDYYYSFGLVAWSTEIQLQVQRGRQMGVVDNQMEI